MTTKDLLQRPCQFFLPDGKELSGMIVEAVEAPPFGAGAIPDFLCKIRGSSGRTMEVSLVSSYLRTTDNL